MTVEGLVPFCLTGWWWPAEAGYTTSRAARPAGYTGAAL
jgi:hypothetical protein